MEADYVELCQLDVLGLEERTNKNAKEKIYQTLEESRGMVRNKSSLEGK